MTSERRLTLLFRAGLIVAAGGILWSLWPAQDADPDYRPRVRAPAFSGENQPVAIIDQGHMNTHTAGGRLRPFAQLLTADGFRVLPSEGQITAEALRLADIFVTVNPLGLQGSLQHVGNLIGLERVMQLAVDAFSQDEIAVLAAWVQNGGSALIVADHAPAGRASHALAAAFGVEMRQWWAEDATHHDPLTRNPGSLLFSRDNGLLADHPINNGRNEDERVNVLLTFTGQSLYARQGEVVLRLADSAREYPYRRSREHEGRSAAGLAQAVALRHGAGRLVFLGEAAMITAQLVTEPGAAPIKIGMNREGIDNEQFASNVMHWLMGLLD